MHLIGVVVAEWMTVYVLYKTWNLPKVHVRGYADCRKNLWMHYHTIHEIIVIIKSCVWFQVKSGPFAEHSNQLWNISAVQSWSKINQGLFKMYKAEVKKKMFLHSMQDLKWRAKVFKVFFLSSDFKQVSDHSTRSLRLYFLTESGAERSISSPDRNGRF